MQEIKYTIAHDGSYAVEVNGVQGPECEALTEALALPGETVVSSKKKPEYARAQPRTKMVTR